MRREIGINMIATVMVAVLAASIFTQHAYALNYRPVEFIREVDGITLGFPFALAIDGEGRLVVADTIAQKVYVMSRGEDGNWHMLGSFDRRSAVDLSFDRHGRLAVLTHVHPEGAIYLYQLTYGDDGRLASAAIVHSIQGVTPERTLFMFPHGLTTLTQDGHDLIIIGGGSGTDRKLQVFEVTDEGISLAFQFNNAEVYDANNSKIGDVVNGSPLTPFPSILDVKADGSGRVMVAYKNGLIGIYSIDFASRSVELIRLFGGAGADLGRFNEPRGIAHDSVNNYLIVSDNLNHRIQVFNYSDVLDPEVADPMPIFYFGSGVPGDGERQLNTPRKVIVNDDKVYVADGSNGRVAILTLDDSIPNDVDEPRIEPLRGSEWYKFTNHREMFNIMGRLLYTALIDNGVPENIATRTALNTTSKELEQVLVQIRSLPNDARLNIPWSSHLKGDTVLQGSVFFKAGCTIGKQGSTGINDPREYHAPPVQVNDTIYCSTTAASLYGSGATIGVNRVTAYFVDPDGVERDVYYYTSAGRQEGIRGMSINANTDFYWEAFAVDVDKAGLWRLVNEYSNGIRVEVPFHVGNSYQFSSRDGLVDAIGSALSNSGFTDDEVQQVIQVIESSDISLPEQGTLIVEARRGSLYAFACILPHDPPLNIGESVQCLILYLSLGSQVTVDDLHVYANAPSTIINIQSWNWAPNTIPDPFIWLSPPINMSEAGTWSIVADFTRGGSVVLSIPVTFNVVPESMIGIAGVLGTSLAVLAYRMRRKNGKSN
ncbi:MAG: hypothetical protein QXI69_01025 [Candidatus Nitrosocaldus sp.]